MARCSLTSSLSRMFLYYEQRSNSGKRRYCRVAWGQWVREGCEQWRLRIQKGHMGGSPQQQEHWFDCTQTLHSQIDQLHRQFLARGFERLSRPSLEQLLLPFHEDEHGTQIDLFAETR